MPHLVQLHTFEYRIALFDYSLEYRKGSADGNTSFLSRQLQADTEQDRSRCSGVTAVDENLRAASFPVPGTGLGKLVPRPDSAVCWVDSLQSP